MRTLACDVHKSFSDVAVHEDGEVRHAGSGATKDLPRKTSATSSPPWVSGARFSARRV